MPNVQITSLPSLETIDGSELVHTKDPGAVESTMTASEIGGLFTPPTDFDPSTPVAAAEEDKIVLLQNDIGGHITIPQLRDLLGGTDYLGDDQDWVDTFFPPGPSQDDQNFFRMENNPPGDIQGEHDLGGLLFKFGRYLRKTDKAEKITFRTPFPNQCVTCHVTPHRDIHPDSIQIPMNASSFAADHFWINRAETSLGLVITGSSWLALGF